MWDLDSETLLSVFTPDSKIQTISLHGHDKGTLLLGFSDMSTLITRTVSKQDAQTKSKNVEETCLGNPAVVKMRKMKKQTRTDRKSTGCVLYNIG